MNQPELEKGAPDSVINVVHTGKSLHGGPGHVAQQGLSRGLGEGTGLVEDQVGGLEAN